MTVKDRETGAPTFPGASMARTENVWAPSARGASVKGEIQLLNAPVSTLHSKVEPCSRDSKRKVGVESVVVLPLAGPAVILAVGGVVSVVVTGYLEATLDVEAASAANDEEHEHAHEASPLHDYEH